ncbi:cation:proton antiporter [Uliginosibacterium paludis]|uniref:Cation:proton antiporter n=1 Tax=Uliginosibacterium paludis TaxID=1615952 RepID=A0ABV2CKA3_9RHOO
MESLLALHFLPQWPLRFDPLISFGIVLFLAIALGELASRLYLPRISAYVATGAALSFARLDPALLDLLPAAHKVYELAFALILFELGQRIDLGWLRRNPWLLATSLAESLLAFVFVGALMLVFDQPPVVAALIAAIASATGPAAVLGVTRDSGSRGQVTDRLQMLAALSACYSFVVVGVIYAWQHAESAAPLSIIVLHPLYLFAGSALLGGIGAWAVLMLLARIRAGNNNQTLAAVALIVVIVALANTLGLSVVLSLLAAGVLTRSFDRQRRLQPMDFGLLSRMSLIVVFVGTGTLLDPAQFATALVPAIGLLAARALGKALGVFAFARPSALPVRKASLLSIGLLPMSGAALLTVERTAALWPDLGAQIAGVVLTALLIMEFLAPPALQFALRRANETGENA